jgi:hypothetical protein
MHSRFLLAAIGLASCLTSSQSLVAGSHKPEDFPLRIQVLGFIGKNHYSVSDELFQSDGEGRANLFEDGQPHAMDIQFKCSRQLRPSVGYETYMARWKRPRQTLELLLPEIGKPGSSSICQLAVDLRETQAYVPMDGGQTAVLPAAAYKLWMERAQYDPEHGKDQPLIPLRLNPNNGQPAPSKAPSKPAAATSPH